MSNELKPSTVYISVDSNDEIPMAEYKDAKFVDEHHWLKEQSLYTFTKTELEEMLRTAWLEAVQICEDLSESRSMYYARTQAFSRYIKQLLP